MNDRDKEDEDLHNARSERSTEGSPGLGANSSIGRQLKAYYDDFANEPVPDRFLSLLDALDAAESDEKPSKGR